MTNPLNLENGTLGQMLGKVDHNKAIIEETAGKLVSFLKEIPGLEETASMFAAHVVVGNDPVNSLMQLFLNSEEYLERSASIALGVTFGVYITKQGWFDEEPTNEPVQEEQTS